MPAAAFSAILAAARARHGAAALEARLGDARLIRHWGKQSVNSYFNGLGQLVSD